MSKYYYEVLYYIKDKEDEDPIYRDFKTLKSALKYYNMIKNNLLCCDIWVTKRDEDGVIIDDIII